MGVGGGGTQDDDHRKPPVRSRRGVAAGTEGWSDVRPRPTEHRQHVGQGERQAPVLEPGRKDDGRRPLVQNGICYNSLIISKATHLNG